MTTTFHDHLLTMTTRPDALGDLARDYAEAVNAGTHPPVADHHQLHRHLRRLGADQEAHAAVDAAHHDHDLDCLCDIPADREVTR